MAKRSVHYARALGPVDKRGEGKRGRGEEKRKAREIKGFACRGASSVVSERVQFAMKLAVSAEG